MGKKRSKKSRRAKATSHSGLKKHSHSKDKQQASTISVCMIVKNEEAFLPQCLESIKAFVDEIIIVDTGSTDGTVAIAESFGAKIYHHPWENDFSKHRNQSLSYATGDWILQIDADEELAAGSGQRLRDTVRKGTADYYLSPFFDINRHGEVTAVYNLIRLFRNNMGMKFTRSVHNQLQMKGKGSFCKIRFNHYGYDLSSEKMEAKHVRTTTMLKKAIEDDPEDGYSHHQLAVSYLVRKEYSKTVEYGEKALKIRRRKNQHNLYDINTFYLVAGAYFKLNDIESAHRTCLEAQAVCGHHLDICHVLTAVYFKQNSLEKCRKMARRYLDIYNQLEDDPSIVGGSICYNFGTSKRGAILTYLAYTFIIEKDYQTADSYFHQAFENAGKEMQTAENIYHLYLEKRVGKQALQWLVTAHEAGCSQNVIPETLKKHPGLYLKVAEYYLQQDALDAVHHCLEYAPDNQLTPGQQMEKNLLQIRAFWIQGAIEELVKKMDSLMTLLGLDTNRCLDSFDDLGSLFYETARELAEKQRWRLAEPTLRLATEIAPSLFEPETFQELMAGAEV
jgi:glycosyltransferase involved in cell wall biosynthesis